MKIFVKAKPNSKIEKVEKLSENNFVVYVKEPPIKGKANGAITRALAEYFKIPISRVQLTSAFSSHQKIFDIVLE